MMGRLIPVAAFTALLLGACSETPTETANEKKRERVWIKRIPALWDKVMRAQ